MKIDAFILSYKREENLKEVVEGVKLQSAVRDIYIIHNAPSSIKIKGAINIILGKNFGCIARHFLTLFSNADYILFVDDDLKLNIDFSSRFKHAILTYPSALIGLFGKNLKKESINPYSEGQSLNSSLEYKEVDIIKGRVHLCNKKILLTFPSFIYQHYKEIESLIAHSFNYNFLNADDLILNFFNRSRGGISLIIPSNYSEIKNLKNNKNALESHNRHLTVRNIITRYFLEDL